MKDALQYRIVFALAITGSLCTGCGFLFYRYRLDSDEKLALAGNTKSAKRVLLPCFKPLLYWLGVAFLVACIGSTWPTWRVDSPGPSVLSRNRYLVVAYNMFGTMIASSIVPVLLTQPTISYGAFWRTFFIMLPWVVIGHMFFVASAVVNSGNNRLRLDLSFFLFVSVPPFLLGVGLLTGYIRSRLHARSELYRSAVVFMMGESVLNLAVNVMHRLVEVDSEETTSLNDNNRFSDLAICMIVVVVLNAFYAPLAPLMIYRTLRGDTKYWRGIGKHNRKGMGVEGGVRDDRHNSATMGIDVAAFSLQHMVEEFKRIAIDFVLIEFVRKVGEGATAWVYESKYRGKICATKVCTPLEYTSDELNAFATEVTIMKMMSHPNIVQFYGICLRPPQMASVMEYCVRGDLSHSLKNKPDLWTDGRKIGAILGCARAVRYLHHFGIMHRDIKPENFLVDAAFVVKLADFGESSHKRGNVVLGKTGVVGSPTYMAPELISNKDYTNSVDIYALAITFWEIWTCKEPFEGLSLFKLYDAVRGGERPPLDEDGFPPFLRAIISMAWVDDPLARPSAVDMVESLASNAEDFFANYEDGDVVRTLQESRACASRAASECSTDSSNASELADYVAELKAYRNPSHKHRAAGTDATVRMNLFGDVPGEDTLVSRAPSGKEVARRHLSRVLNEADVELGQQEHGGSGRDIDVDADAAPVEGRETLNPIRAASRENDDAC